VDFCTLYCEFSFPDFKPSVTWN